MTSYRRRTVEPRVSLQSNHLFLLIVTFRPRVLNVVSDVVGFKSATVLLPHFIFAFSLFKQDFFWSEPALYLLFWLIGYSSLFGF